jgi:hypothetical protein
MLQRYTVDHCKIFEFSKVADPRGNLTFIEGNVSIPFAIKRVYYLYDVPGGTERGAHAHRELFQIIISITGSFDVVLDDGSNQKVVHLSRSHQGLYLTPHIWRTLKNFSTGASCLVLASEYFSEPDYIRSYDEFLEFRRVATC